jgi:hypothetical protein
VAFLSEFKKKNVNFFPSFFWWHFCLKLTRHKINKYGTVLLLVVDVVNNLFFSSLFFLLIGVVCRVIALLPCLQNAELKRVRYRKFFTGIKKELLVAMFCNQDISLNFVSHIGFGVLACSYCIKRLLHLRICIAVSNLVLILWALTALPTASCVSTSAWNSLFFYH